MNKQEKYELIEAFLDDHETVEERERVEKTMKDDPTLQAEIELHRQLADVTRGEKFHELRAALKETDTNWQMSGGSSGGRVIKMSFMKMAIAACVVVLLGVAVWLNFSSPSATDLFASNFEPYDMVLTQRSMGEDISVDLDEAIINYIQGNYTEAELQFQQLAIINPDQPILKMYECISALAQGRSESSIACFNGLLGVPNLSEQARWYLGLAFLQSGDMDMARETLEKISEGTYQYKEAQDILNEI